ncbi:MAG: hypothetical protein ACLFT6_07160 [Bacteroidales bacterium]
MTPGTLCLPNDCEIKNLTPNIEEETFTALVEIASDILIRCFSEYEKPSIKDITITDTDITPEIDSSYCESIKTYKKESYNRICILFDEIDLLERAKKSRNQFAKAIQETLYNSLYKPTGVKYNKHNYTIMALLHEMGHAKLFMEDGILNRQEVHPFMFDSSEDCARAYRNLPQEKFADDFARAIISREKYRRFLK